MLEGPRPPQHLTLTSSLKDFIIIIIIIIVIIIIIIIIIIIRLSVG